MTAFVRFIFTILIVGAALNLAIVLLANAQSQNRRKVQYDNSSQYFRDLVAEIEGHARRASIVVESQRFDAHRHVLESTLLIRQYHFAAKVVVAELDGRVIPFNGNNQAWPLPVVRIVIPGDRLQVGGLLLEFDKIFAADRSEYAPLQGRQIALFGQFCGEGEAAPAGPNAVDERFTYLPRDQTPELLRTDLQYLENTQPDKDLKSDFLKKLPSWKPEWDFSPNSPEFLEWKRRMAIALQQSDSPESVKWMETLKTALEDPVFLSQVRASNFVLRPQESYFDLNLWQYLWSQIPENPRDSVNHAPAGTDKTLITSQDTPNVLATADFGFTDPNDTPPNNLLAVKITTLPAAGTLTNNGLGISAGTFVSVTDIAAGKLVFTPASGATGSPYASFTFQVQDNGGTANGGVDLDPTPNTLNINVVTPATKLPPSSDSKISFDAKWLKPAVITVHIERTYTAFVNVDGTVTLSEDDPPQTTLLNAMLKEFQDAQETLKVSPDE